MKLTKAQRLKLNEEADRLYDRYNPRPHQHIYVPRDQCVREAAERLGFTNQG